MLHFCKDVSGVVTYCELGAEQAAVTPAGGPSGGFPSLAHTQGSRSCALSRGCPGWQLRGWATGRLTTWGQDFAFASETRGRALTLCPLIPDRAPAACRARPAPRESLGEG